MQCLSKIPVPVLRLIKGRESVAQISERPVLCESLDIVPERVLDLVVVMHVMLRDLSQIGRCVPNLLLVRLRVELLKLLL